MANVLGCRTVDGVYILNVDADPSAGAGTLAPLGSIALTNNGVGTFTKTGVSDTAWSSNSDVPLWATQKQYLFAENFDKGVLPQGWSTSLLNGGTSIYSTASENFVPMGMAIVSTTAVLLSRAGLAYGTGFQYMRNFTDAIRTSVYFIFRYNGFLATIGTAHIFGFFHSHSSTEPSALGNCLGVMYDPTNVSGFNPGLITNVFLLARATYGAPANTTVDLGFVPSPFFAYPMEIVYDNVLAEVRVYLNNILVGTLTDLSNVPGGAVRGVVPIGANGMGVGLYMGSSSVVVPNAASSIRVFRFSVFKQFQA